MHSYKGKQKKDIDSKTKDKTFQDVGGCNKAVDALKEIIDFIKNPALYK